MSGEKHTAEPDMIKETLGLARELVRELAPHLLSPESRTAAGIAEERFAWLQGRLATYAVHAARGRDDLQAQRDELLAACEVALKELNSIAGYSGAAGNWPLQDATAQVRSAIAKVRG